MGDRFLPVLSCVLALTQFCASAGESVWQRITPIRRGPVMSMSIDAEEPQPTRAVRLIFEYEGDRVRLVSEQSVDIAITGADLPQGPAPGIYVDARTGENRTLARVPARGAFASSLEVFPENPGEPITRVDVAEPRGAFTVIVPVSDATDHVTIMRIAAPSVEVPGREAAPPEMIDLVSFPLTAGK